MTGAKENVEGKERLMFQNLPHHLSWKHCKGMSIHVCCTVSGTGLMLFTENVNADKSSRMNSVVYRAILYAHVQSNAGRAFHTTDG